MNSFRLRIRAAAERFADELCDAVQASLPEQLEWIDQDRSPLGRRKHMRLAREGKLPFRREGKQVFVHRKDIDAYLAGLPAADRSATANEDEDEDEDEDLALARMAQRGGFQISGIVRRRP